MWATLQDQSFLLGAVLVILVHATKFGELNLANPVTGRYLALLPGAKVRDFVGPYAYHVALLAFLSVSLVAYYLTSQVIGYEAHAQKRQKCDVVRVGPDEISDFRAGQQREIAAGHRVSEVQLTELGCMNKDDEHGSKQKGLVLQRGPHGATPRLASAVGTESLRYDHLTVRGGIEGFGRCLLRGADDDCDKKHCCEDHFHFSLRNLSPSAKLNKLALDL